MPLFAVYPWLAGQFVSGGEMMKFLKHLPAAGALGVVLAGVGHNYAIQLVVAVPSAIFVLCVVSTRWVSRTRARTNPPIDGDFSAPPPHEEAVPK
jgi:hypothetical protein